MPKAKEHAGGSMAQAQQDAVADGIENFELPRSVVMKLARASQVPENTKFSKEVILGIVKASTVFINYLAATAHEVASSKQHKSISATDVLKALELVEFGDIAKNIQGELQVYRDLQKADKKKGGKGKARDASDSASAAAKPKGKAKASAATDGAQQHQVPTIHIPRPSGQPATGPPSDVDPDDHGQSEEVDEDQEMPDQDEEVPDDVDEDLDEPEDEEGVEPEDTMALDEEELQRDSRGLDAYDANGE
ncbi:histone-fold-containing protein [Pilatotrama ljubarskyi]|nr:histone-fold-containing protein [Pilatotrama ljubarskyi]